jgi:hypothetical protein
MPFSYWSFDFATVSLTDLHPPQVPQTCLLQDCPPPFFQSTRFSTYSYIKHDRVFFRYQACCRCKSLRNPSGGQSTWNSSSRQPEAWIILLFIGRHSRVRTGPLVASIDPQVSDVFWPMLPYQLCCTLCVGLAMMEWLSLMRQRRQPDHYHV